MSTRKAASDAHKAASDVVSSLGLPSELLELLSQMGIDIHSLTQEAEHSYIQQLIEFAQGLPSEVQNPVDVRDPSAFASFLSNKSHSYFKKYLSLINMKNVIDFEPGSHRFRAEHYIPPLARMITRRDVPMYMVTKCLDIFAALAENGENVLPELCKVSELPSSIGNLIERICDDSATQLAVMLPKILVEDLIKLLCNIVIKACSSGRLKPSGSSDPGHSHAQSLYSTCMRLLSRFKPLPVAAVAHAVAPPSIQVSMPAIPLELLWAIGCLICSEVPFPQADYRSFFNELLQYIDLEKNSHTMHAIAGCLHATLSKLHASPSEGSSSVDAALLLQKNAEKQRAICSLVKLLLLHPCELGCQGLEQPPDYTGDSQGRRLRRRLAGHLASLQSCTLFDLSLQIICGCIDSIEMASFCVSNENGALLSIVSKKLHDSTRSKDIVHLIELIEKLTDFVCNSQHRHAIAAGDTFPADLVAPLREAMKTQRLRQFFQETYENHSHAQRLHGGMVVPEHGEFPSMTLKQIANRDESGGIPVLGYAAATNLRSAVRLLLRLGADPNGTGSCGKTAMQMNIEHNSSSSEMLDLLQSVKEVQIVSVKDTSKGDHELCLRATGKHAVDLVRPLLEVLLDGAAATAHSEICFSIFLSFFNTIASVHPAILENVFISSVPVNSDKSPKASSTPDDTPSSFSDPSAPGFKLRASSIADKFFKLLRASAKKFSKSNGIGSLAFDALSAVLVLFKLPTSRPLVRLCHRLHLVDPTLAELARTPGPSPAASALWSGMAGGGAAEEEQDEEDEDDEEEQGDEDEEPEEVAIGRMMRMRERERLRELQRAMRAQDLKVAPSSVDSSQLQQLLCELRAFLVSHDVSSSDQTHTHDFDLIANALNAAVIGSSGFLSDAKLISATDAIKLLCDHLKGGTLSEQFDSPEGFKVIEALCSFLTSDQPAPAPVGSVSKAVRLSQFRDVACPLAGNCDGLQAVIQHVKTLFEDNLSDILALLGSKPVLPNLQSFSHFFGQSTRTVHLLPIPSDDGCSQHYGSVQSTFRHNIYSDMTGVATSLNCKNPVQEELPAAEAPAPPQLRHPGQQQNFEVDWKELTIARPLSDNVSFTLKNLDGHGFRFKAAVPSAQFTSRAKQNSALKSQGGAAKQSPLLGMSKSARKRAKQRAKRSSAEIAGSSVQESDAAVLLQPCDIARVRLFLCFHSDVRNGKLPAIHLEIDPRRPLADSISEFEKLFGEGSSPAPAPGEPSLFGGGLFSSSGRSEKPVAIFYGSGNHSQEPLVPDELRWRVETLEAHIENGDVRILDVVVAIKSAMPLDWLSEHGFDADCTSIVFSMSNRDILDAYTAALQAWGAENIIAPVIDDNILSRGVIPIESVAATTFDVAKTIGQPSAHARGFSFSGENLRVRFPNGPISCFTQALVGPLSPLKFAHFSFKDNGGNCAWSVGLIPEAQSHNSNVLWGTRGIIGRHYQGSGGCLQQVRTNQGDILTQCVDAVQGVWFLCVNGKIVARDQVPASHFPARLGLCGHNGSSFEIIPHATVPAEVANQCKLASPACSSGPVIWQWLRDDGSWASYDALHIPALEKSYHLFISKPHNPSRAFIEVNAGNCSIRYQFDFKEPISAPQATPDAPREHSVCSVVGTQTNLTTMKVRQIRRCTSASPPAVALAQAESYAGDDALRSEFVLHAMQLLSRELEVCAMAVPSPDLVDAPDLSAILRHSLSQLHSSLLSAQYQASKSSECRGWSKLASEVPLLLDPNTRLSLFRKACGVSSEELENTKKDRVNGVERSHILDWAAAIVSAQLKQGRHNPLAIQPILSQFSRDGVPEQGFGEAVTNSFFCDVADAFALADTGMWIINNEDIEFLRDSSDGVVNVHQPLAARGGLYFQPYCASVPMPPEVLSRFKLLGAMMAKAIQDGRAFPLRISYAVARCICGETLHFDDLSSILNFHHFNALKQIKSSESSGDEWGLVFSEPANMVAQGCVVARPLHLVEGGDGVEVTAANAQEYLRAVERLYLGDGIAMQVQALRSGFYSIIPQEKISILGASGLWHLLGALACPEFDREDLRIGFEPKHGYTVDSPQYQWLIETLLTFDEDQRRATVRFLTGSPSLPSGFQGLPKRLTVQLLLHDNGQPVGDSYLPVIQCCFGLFKLPRYSSAEILREKLLYAVLAKYARTCRRFASGALTFILRSGFLNQ